MAAYGPVARTAVERREAGVPIARGAPCLEKARTWSDASRRSAPSACPRERSVAPAQGLDDGAARAAKKQGRRSVGLRLPETLSIPAGLAFGNARRRTAALIALALAKRHIASTPHSAQKFMNDQGHRARTGR